MKKWLRDVRALFSAVIREELAEEEEFKQALARLTEANDDLEYLLQGDKR